MNKGNSLYGVKTKRSIFNIKINPEVRSEFKVAAELRGATMSSLIHQYIFKYIREVKTEMPEEFEAKLAKALADKAMDELDAFEAEDTLPSEITLNTKGGR